MQQLVDCDTVDSACNGELTDNSFNFAEKTESQLHRNAGSLQGLELHREDRPGKCHGIQRRVHRQRAGFDVDSGTVSTAEAGTKTLL